MGLSISGLKARVLQPHGSLRSRLLSFLIPGIWWLQGPELLFCRRKLLLKEQNRLERSFKMAIPREVYETLEKEMEEIDRQE